MIGRIFLGKRDLGVRAIHARRTGIDQMRNIVRAAGLKHVGEPNQIRLDVGVRVP